MKPNLVLARVGASSLHPGWIDGAGERTFDLRLCPFQELPDQSGLDLEVGPVVPGPKWTGLREALRAWDGWRDYERIWMPDDDIQTRPETIDRMFAAAETLGFDLFAPALDETSYFAHFDTMRNPRFFARRTGFVEIMVPGFTREGLERVLHTLDESETGWGWGLDSVWPKLLGYERVGVIDGVPVSHTRPVGAMRDEDLGRRVHAESDALLARYECRQEHVTYEGYGEDGRPLGLAPEELLGELVRGWDYLIERDPRLLAWISEFQRPGGGWPVYPTAGTPSGG